MACSRAGVFCGGFPAPGALVRCPGSGSLRRAPSDHAREWADASWPPYAPRRVVFTPNPWLGNGLGEERHTSVAEQRKRPHSLCVQSPPERHPAASPTYTVSGRTGSMRLRGSQLGGQSVSTTGAGSRVPLCVDGMIRRLQGAPGIGTTVHGCLFRPVTQPYQYLGVWSGRAG